MARGRGKGYAQRSPATVHNVLFCKYKSTIPVNRVATISVRCSAMPWEPTPTAGESPLSWKNPAMRPDVQGEKASVKRSEYWNYQRAGLRGR